MQGSADDFLAKGQLLPKNFVAACADAKVPVVLRMQEVQMCRTVLFQTFCRWVSLLLKCLCAFSFDSLLSSTLWNACCLQFILSFNFLCINYVREQVISFVEWFRETGCCESHFCFYLHCHSLSRCILSCNIWSCLSCVTVLRTSHYLGGCLTYLKLLNLVGFMANSLV